MSSAPARRSSRSIPTSSRRPIRSTEANRSGAAADVQYWRQQVTAARGAGHGRGDQPARVGAGAELPQDVRSQAGRDRCAGERRARAAPVLSRRRAAGGRRRRHPDPGRRSRHAVDRHHDDRREQRARGVHPGAGRSRAAAASGAARAAARHRRQARRSQSDLVRGPAGRRVDAVGARQEPAEGRAAAAARAAVRAGADRLEHRTGA